MKLRFVLVMVCALLALTPTALGGERWVGRGRYGGNAGDVQQEVNQGALPASAAKAAFRSRSRPGLARRRRGGLLIVGAGLRRAANRPS
jgi:hypothetical protein